MFQACQFPQHVLVEKDTFFLSASLLFLIFQGLLKSLSSRVGHFAADFFCRVCAAGVIALPARPNVDPAQVIVPSRFSFNRFLHSLTNRQTRSKDKSAEDHP
jgi:hypothetical protein